MRSELSIDWSRYRLHDEEIELEVEQLQPCEFTSLAIPPLEERDWLMLAESVRESKQVHTPVIVTADQKRVIDGRARLRAARQAGLTTIPGKVLELLETGEEETDYALWAAHENAGRRHLTTAQRFAILQAALRVLEQRARASQALTQFRSRNGTESHEANKAVGANLHRPETPIGRTREQAARLVGVSPRQADKMIQVIKHGSDDLQQAVAEGQLSVHQAHKSLAASRGRHDAVPRGRPVSSAVHRRLAEQPAKTLRKVAAQLAEWLGECSTWPRERQEEFWSALGTLMDSCEMALRRRAAGAA